MTKSVRCPPFHRVLFVLLTAVFSAAVPAHGQRVDPVANLAPSDTIREVRLVGGESYVGRIVGVDAQGVTIETSAMARVVLPREAIASVGIARGRMVRGQFWPEDPNTTRLFFSPTARSLRAGAGYFGVYEVVIPFVAYGLTDQIVLAGGSPFYLAITEDFTPPFYFAPKVQVVARPGVLFAVGAVALVTPEDTRDVYGIAYGVGTVGNNDQAFTGGIGWGYVNSDLSSQPVVMLGGETRVSRSIKLLTENLFVPGEAGVVSSAGVRFFGERLSADAGLAGGFGDDAFCCFPLVNFVWHFGK